MDQIAAMRVLVAVTDEASFTKAAERLGMSRAMASKHVQDLEARLGVRLMNRTTRRVGLTAPGSAYVERCRDLLADLEAAEREATSEAAEPIGRLRISASVAFGSIHVAPLIGAFVARHPRVGIELVLGDRYVDLVEEGYDMAIRIGRLADSTLLARRIGTTRLVIAASPAYIARHGTPAAPADLTGHACLRYAYANDGDVWDFLGADGRQTVRIASGISSNSGEALCQMAVSGLGIVRAPDFIVASHLATGRLVELLADYAVEPLGIHAVHPMGRHVPTKVRAFIDHLAGAQLGVLSDPASATPDAGTAPPRARAPRVRKKA